MTVADVRQLLARQAQAWIDKDIEQALPDFAPDAIFQSPGGRWQGHDQIRQTANAFFASVTDMKITITRVIFDGSQGTVEWTWEETRRDTHAHHIAEDAIVFELVDGKIVYWREYFDTAQMNTPVTD